MSVSTIAICTKSERGEMRRARKREQREVKEKEKSKEELGERAK